MTSGAKASWTTWWRIWQVCVEDQNDTASLPLFARCAGRRAGCGYRLVDVRPQSRRLAIQRVEPGERGECEGTFVGMGFPDRRTGQTRNHAVSEGQRDVHHGSGECGLRAGSLDG